MGLKSLMESDARHIIQEWAEYVTIKTILPKDQQPDWNPIMNEIVGDPRYDEQNNIPIEKVMVYDNSHHDSKVEVISAGDRYNHRICVNIPQKVKNQETKELVDVMLNEDSIIVYNDIDYKVESLFAKIGEWTVTLQSIRLRE